MMSKNRAGGFPSALFVSRGTCDWGIKNVVVSRGTLETLTLATMFHVKQ